MKKLKKIQGEVTMPRQRMQGQAIAAAPIRKDFPRSLAATKRSPRSADTSLSSDASRDSDDVSVSESWNELNYDTVLYILKKHTRIAAAFRVN